MVSSGDRSFWKVSSASFRPQIPFVLLVAGLSWRRLSISSATRFGSDILILPSQLDSTADDDPRIFQQAGNGGDTRDYPQAIEDFLR
jgi:hypothetical protein